MNFFIQFFAYVFDCENFLKCFSILSRSCSFVSTNIGDNSLFMAFHMNSMGLRSGEYGGRNIRSMLSFSAVSVVNFAWWDLKLSSMIIIRP